MIWKPKLLVGIRRAQAAGLTMDEIAEGCDLTTTEVEAALAALKGRNPDQAAAHLNGLAPLTFTPVEEAGERRSPGAPEAKSWSRPAGSTSIEAVRPERNYEPTPAVKLTHDDRLVDACREGGGFAVLDLKLPARRVARPPFSAGMGKRAADRSVSNPSRAAPAVGHPAAPRPRVERVKPVTDRIAGWAWWFVAAGWSLEETAGLFDVDAEALGPRLGRMEGAVA